MEIITKRLLLREFTEGDLPGLVAYRADRQYAEFDQAPDNHARELLTLFLRWAAEVPRRNYQLAIAPLGAPRELMGCCGLRGQGLDAGRAEFGIEVAPRWWGHGYATEAARALLRVGFRELELHEVRGVSVTQNTRVTSLVSRLGFVSVGSSDGPAWIATRGWSQTQWLLTRQRWEATEAA